MFGEIFIIPLVLRTRGIINISPNTRAIFHFKYFSNRVISYTNYLLAPYFHFDEFFENLLKFKFFVLYVCMINIVSDKLVETPKINLRGFSETELILLKFPFWEFNLTNFSVGR